jgi:hypothetical protein
MCYNNGFTGIRELDLQIIIDLWFVKYTDRGESEKIFKQAIRTTLNLYYTCHYFRNLLDEPMHYRQFQNMIGYKVFDRFDEINSLDKLIKALPMRIKNDDEDSIKLAKGNVVSISHLGKNYRIIEASDSYARMIEIDIKGMIVDRKIMEIFSENFRWSRDDRPFVSQSWNLPSHGRSIDADFIVWEAPGGFFFNMDSIEHEWFRYWGYN